MQELGLLQENVLCKYSQKGTKPVCPDPAVRQRRPRMVEGRHRSCCPRSWLVTATCLLRWLGLSQINGAGHRLNSTVNEHICLLPGPGGVPLHNGPSPRSLKGFGLEHAGSPGCHTNVPPKVVRKSPTLPRSCSSRTNISLENLLEKLQDFSYLQLKISVGTKFHVTSHSGKPAQPEMLERVNVTSGDTNLLCLKTLPSSYPAGESRSSDSTRRGKRRGSKV